jgi:hypothetical protein
MRKHPSRGAAQFNTGKAAVALALSSGRVIDQEIS